MFFNLEITLRNSNFTTYDIIKCKLLLRYADNHTTKNNFKNHLKIILKKSFISNLYPNKIILKTLSNMLVLSFSGSNMILCQISNVHPTYSIFRCPYILGFFFSFYRNNSIWVNKEIQHIRGEFFPTKLDFHLYLFNQSAYLHLSI